MVETSPNSSTAPLDIDRSGPDRWSRTVHIAGWATIIAWLLSIPLSFGIAVVTPFNSRTPREISVLQNALEGLQVEDQMLLRDLRQYLAGRSPLASEWVTTAVFLAPLCIATAGLALVWRATRRHAAQLTESHLHLLLRFAIGIGISCTLMYPMFTQDFWMSIAWGRMIVDGDNPYYNYFTTQALDGLPLFFEESYMTYGPLWGWISALIAAASGRNELVEFIAVKSLLWAGWAGCLYLICRIMRGCTVVEKARAVLLFGWMPLTYFLTIAEGHNDVIMVLPMLLWLYAVSIGRHWIAPFALAASVLVKYVTLPLVAVELWRGWMAMRGRRIAYTGALAATAASAALCLLPLAHSLEFLSATRQMQKWHMLTPAKALIHVSNWLHLSISGRVYTMIVLVMLTALFMYYLVPALRQYDFDKLLSTILSGLLIVLLVVVGHVWPWFVLWVLAPAIIAPRSLAKDFAIALALAAPFVHVYWIWGHEWAELKYATVAYYATVSSMVLIVRWYRRHQLRPALSRT